MPGWDELFKEVREACLELGRADGNGLFYRGQVCDEWNLLPSLARVGHNRQITTLVKDMHGNNLSIQQWIENSLYYQLHARGGHLLPRNPRPWEILFLMRHHGFPTRLLDWTRSFGIALFFAISRTAIQNVELAGKAAAVWIMNPGRLNIATRQDTSEVVCYLDTDYPIGYEQYFAHHLGDHYGTFPHEVVASWADSSNERLRAQRGAFTLHRDLSVPLESSYPACLRKIVIPPVLYWPAVEFLNYAGIDHTSLFPDIDALAAFLVQTVVG